MTNVFKIRHGKETHVYRTDISADKKNLLTQFRHVAEELAAKKRKEREERERAEAEQKAARRAKMEQFSSDILSGEESEAEDPGSAHKLSQKARQPRKASKKALEEMSREKAAAEATRGECYNAYLIALF